MEYDIKAICNQGRENKITSQGSSSKDELEKSRRQREAWKKANKKWREGRGRHYSKTYYQKNKITLAAASKNWQKNNPLLVRKSQSKYRSKHRIEINKRAVARRNTNPDRAKAIKKEWRSKNKEKERQYRKAGSQKHRAYYRIWKTRNPERIKKYQSGHAKRNPAKMCAKSSLRRARLVRAAIGDCEIIKNWQQRWRSKKQAFCFQSRTVVSKTRDVLNPDSCTHREFLAAFATKT